jgi:hypothetical protein
MDGNKIMICLRWKQQLCKNCFTHGGPHIERETCREVPFRSQCPTCVPANLMECDSLKEISYF